MAARAQRKTPFVLTAKMRSQSALVHRRHRRRGDDPRVGDEDVEAAEPALHLGDHALHVRRGGDVGQDARGSAARGARSRARVSARSSLEESS